MKEKLIILILGYITRPVEHGYGISIGCISRCLGAVVNGRNRSCVPFFECFKILAVTVQNAEKLDYER